MRIWTNLFTSKHFHLSASIYILKIISQIFIHIERLHTALNLYFSDSERNITGYDEIYVGHTPTINYGFKEPLKVCEIYMMDTGAGWPGGVLSIMNIDTKEVFTSEQVDILYSGVRGRGF